MVMWWCYGDLVVSWCHGGVMVMWWCHGDVVVSCNGRVHIMRVGLVFTTIHECSCLLLPNLI